MGHYTLFHEQFHSHSTLTSFPINATSEYMPTTLKVMIGIVSELASVHQDPLQ